MRRGELWTASAGQGKPRSVLIVQDDRFDATDSVTVCLITITNVEIPLLRIPLQPNKTNGHYDRQDHHGSQIQARATDRHGIDDGDAATGACTVGLPRHDWLSVSRH